MTHPAKIALFFIAACAVSTGTMGQKVYKCGATYSQIPCTDGVTVNAADTRTPEQKSATEHATQRDAKTAGAMEKTRLKEEKELLQAQKSAAKESAKAKPKAADPAATTASASSGEHKGGAKSKKKEPEFFTATAPAEKKK